MSRVVGVRARRAAWSAALVGLLCLSWVGLSATFTSSAVSPTQEIVTGTGEITLSEPGAYTLATPVEEFVPGDWIERPVDLASSATFQWGYIDLEASATPDNSLTEDLMDGLRLQLLRCSVAWVETAPGSRTYSCAGTSSTLVADSAYRNNLDDIGPLSVTGAPPAATDHLLVKVRLPVGADNTFQDLSANLTMTFSATQRDGAAR